MIRRGISQRTHDTLARSWVLSLDGSGPNCMDATTSLNHDGLTITGSMEAIVEAIAFIALEVGSHRNDDESDELINALESPRTTMLSGDEIEVRFPYFRVL